MSQKAAATFKKNPLQSHCACSRRRGGMGSDQNMRIFPCCVSVTLRRGRERKKIII